MSSHFAVDVPATSANMGPGFDCFGIALKLYNTFLFKTLDEPGSLVFNADFPLRQNPKSNLIYKAYAHALKTFGYKEIPGIEINVISRIPSARGLGSSASAVVAGVLAAGAVSDTNLRLSEAIDLAVDIEGHPDNVAPAILGNMTISINEPSFIYTERVPFPKELAIMVAIPDVKVHTANSRKVLPNKVLFEDASFNLRRTALMIASLYNKDWTGLRHAMFDRLHQHYRANLVPGLMRILHLCRSNGAYGAVLSGSGPSVMMIIPKHNNKDIINRLSRQIKNTWKKMNINCSIKTLDVQEYGTRIQPISAQEFENAIRQHTQ